MRFLGRLRSHLRSSYRVHAGRLARLDPAYAIAYTSAATLTIEDERRRPKPLGEQAADASQCGPWACASPGPARRALRGCVVEVGRSVLRIRVPAGE
jgi:hypothetical protein